MIAGKVAITSGKVITLSFSTRLLAFSSKAAGTSGQSLGVGKKRTLGGQAGRQAAACSGENLGESERKLVSTKHPTITVAGKSEKYEFLSAPLGTRGRKCVCP